MRLLRGLQGLVKIVDGSGSQQRLIAVHGPGRFLGELQILTGQAVLFTAVALEPGEVLAIAADDLRRLASRASA